MSRRHRNNRGGPPRFRHDNPITYSEKKRRTNHMEAILQAMEEEQNKAFGTPMGKNIGNPNSFGGRPRAPFDERDHFVEENPPFEPRHYEPDRFRGSPRIPFEHRGSPNEEYFESRHHGSFRGGPRSPFNYRNSPDEDYRSFEYRRGNERDFIDHDRRPFDRSSDFRNRGSFRRNRPSGSRYHDRSRSRSPINDRRHRDFSERSRGFSGPRSLRRSRSMSLERRRNFPQPRFSRERNDFREHRGGSHDSRKKYFSPGRDQNYTEARYEPNSPLRGPSHHQSQRVPSGEREPYYARQNFDNQNYRSPSPYRDERSHYSHHSQFQERPISPGSPPSFTDIPFSRLDSPRKSIFHDSNTYIPKRDENRYFRERRTSPGTPPSPPVISDTRYSNLDERNPPQRSPFHSQNNYLRNNDESRHSKDRHFQKNQSSSVDPEYFPIGPLSTLERNDLSKKQFFQNPNSYLPNRDEIGPLREPTYRHNSKISSRSPQNYRNRIETPQKSSFGKSNRYLHDKNEKGSLHTESSPYQDKFSSRKPEYFMYAPDSPQKSPINNPNSFLHDRDEIRPLQNVSEPLQDCEIQSTENIHMSKSPKNFDAVSGPSTSNLTGVQFNESEKKDSSPNLSFFDSKDVNLDVTDIDLDTEAHLDLSTSFEVENPFDTSLMTGNKQDTEKDQIYKSNSKGKDPDWWNSTIASKRKEYLHRRRILTRSNKKKNLSVADHERLRREFQKARSEYKRTIEDAKKSKIPTVETETTTENSKTSNIQCDTPKTLEKINKTTPKGETSTTSNENVETLETSIRSENNTTTSETEPSTTKKIKKPKYIRRMEHKEKLYKNLVEEYGEDVFSNPETFKTIQRGMNNHQKNILKHDVANYFKKITQKCDNPITIPIVLNRFPVKKLNRYIGALVMKYLMSKIEAEGGRKPKFSSVKLDGNGVLMVDCNDQQTCEWLRNVIFTSPPIGKNTLRITNINEVTMLKISVTVPGRYLPMTEFLAKVAYHNPTVQTKRWRIISEKHISRTLTRYFIEMSQKCWNEIEIRNNKLIYDCYDIEFEVKGLLSDL